MLALIVFCSVSGWAQLYAAEAPDETIKTRKLEAMQLTLASLRGGIQTSRFKEARLLRASVAEDTRSWQSGKQQIDNKLEQAKRGCNAFEWPEYADMTEELQFCLGHNLSITLPDSGRFLITKPINITAGCHVTIQGRADLVCSKGSGFTVLESGFLVLCQVALFNCSHKHDYVYFGPGKPAAVHIAGNYAGLRLMQNASIRDGLGAGVRMESNYGLIDLRQGASIQNFAGDNACVDAIGTHSKVLVDGASITDCGGPGLRFKGGFVSVNVSRSLISRCGHAKQGTNSALLRVVGNNATVAVSDTEMSQSYKTYCIWLTGARSEYRFSNSICKSSPYGILLANANVVSIEHFTMSEMGKGIQVMFCEDIRFKQVTLIGSKQVGIYISARRAQLSSITVKDTESVGVQFFGTGGIGNLETHDLLLTDCGNGIEVSSAHWAGSKISIRMTHTALKLLANVSVSLTGLDLTENIYGILCDRKARMRGELEGYSYLNSVVDFQCPSAKVAFRRHFILRVPSIEFEMMVDIVILWAIGVTIFIPILQQYHASLARMRLPTKLLWIVCIFSWLLASTAIVRIHSVLKDRSEPGPHKFLRALYVHLSGGFAVGVVGHFIASFTKKRVALMKDVFKSTRNKERQLGILRQQLLSLGAWVSNQSSSGTAPQTENEIELTAMSTGTRQAERVQAESLQDKVVPNAEILKEYARVFRCAQEHGLTGVQDEAIEACELFIGETDVDGLHKLHKDAELCPWPEFAKRISVRLDAIKEDSACLGIQLDYILSNFQSDAKAKMQELEWRWANDGLQYTLGTFVQRFKGSYENPPTQWLQAPAATPPSDPNFVQLAPVVAYGKLGLGLNKVCPRDGLPHCAIVDGVNSLGYSGKANQFLSWVWTYPFSVVVPALERWSATQLRINTHFEAKATYIWWCFFACNQFRILQDMVPQETNVLADVFGQRLRGVGRLMLLMDTVQNSKLITRIWCVFEMFVACDYDVPCTIIMPDSALQACKAIKTLPELSSACRVDAEQAKASMLADEVGIKKLIVDAHGSFQQVNRVVKRALLVCIAEALENE